MPVIVTRRSQLCDQTRLTGIDFIRVLDPAVQTELQVFFIVDPDKTVVTPGAPPVTMVNPAGPFPIALGVEVTATAIGGGESVASLNPTTAKWQEVTFDGETRIVLHLVFEEPGDFSRYRLFIDHPSIDGFFNNVPFSFKQGCYSPFDCEQDECCADIEKRDVDIDYLARDFESLNHALSDFAARHYPEWGEDITADTGVMIRELFSALGDEFAYIQDRYAREAFLETATHRRSLLRLARLLDYIPDNGRNAVCELALHMADQSADSEASELDYAERLAFWSVPEGRPPIAFELGEGLHDTGSLLVHQQWNEMAIHVPDPGEPCLQAGATELFLAPDATNIRIPRTTQVPAGGLTADTVWIGRRMILTSAPSDPSLPKRSWAVTITQVDRSAEDGVILTGGSATQLTRIGWDQSEALPFAMRIAETTVLGNVAQASAGLTVRERFRAGEAEDAAPLSEKTLPRAIEREGPLDAQCKGRPAVMLYGIRASEEGGLNHVGEHDFRSFRVPDVTLTQLPSTGGPTSDIGWSYSASLLDADEDDRVFTLEPGTWREIIRWQRQGREIVHSDLASPDGYTVRFGSGEFGRLPEDGAVFEIAFRTFYGSRSNVAAGAITGLIGPGEEDRPATLDDIVRVENPLPAALGVDPETAQRIRQNAPEFYKAFPLNAVRSEHFREIVEREEWVQQAGARSRWTGSWLTEFVTADPRDAFAYTPQQRSELENLVDEVRLAGRQVCVRDPRFVPIDLEIGICVAPGHYDGDVSKAVIAALVGEKCSDSEPFFDPDRFTFGDPLRRIMLEAAVQSVPGVLGVTSICIRRRGTLDWQPFAEAEFQVAMNEIIRLDNDPDAPERGSLHIRVSETATDTGCACCVS